ncbi:MAG: hypothetical protein R3D55_25635 [Chloroflexota bacterium]
MCDGCGSKFVGENGRSAPSHNETGANLAGQFALDFLSQTWPPCPAPSAWKPWKPLWLICTWRQLTFLHLTAHFPEANRCEFVATRLLTTLVGFVRTEGTAVFFWQGDGLWRQTGPFANSTATTSPTTWPTNCSSPSLPKPTSSSPSCPSQKICAGSPWPPDGCINAFA